MKNVWSEWTSLTVGSAFLAGFLTQPATALGADSPIGIIPIDLAGPQILSAERAYGSPSVEAIDVIFDEPPLASTVTTNSLHVIQSGTAGADAVYVAVTNILVSGRTVRLKVEQWSSSECYYILANGISDRFGGMIPANTVKGITMSLGAEACPVPGDGPLAELRLAIQPDGESRMRISWPAGYYGFTLESRELDPEGTTDWRPVSDQRNGSFVGDGPNRIFRLRK